MQQENLNNLRHSLAHLLAAAVMELWPDTKRTIGPAIEDGFYFDFDFKEPISDKDLPAIEAKMRELLPAWHTFERHELSGEEAKEEYPENQYKHELIDEFTQNGEKVSFYKSGDYWDLCKGGHVENMQDINPEAFKLTKVTGAYWRGNEKNPMLTRIYGVAFPTKEELDTYLERIEEAKKRDHRVLGQKLDLFTFSDLVGAGLPLFTPKGNKLRELLTDYLQSIQTPLGYANVWIPHIGKSELYKTSGHWDKFKEDLFYVTGKSKEEFVMKPMNCPHHNQIYASKPRSYRDLPIRYAEVTTNYRDEQTGQLHGLSRVRSLTQDDAHVYCRPDQIHDEIMKMYSIISQIYTTFAMPLKIRLSLRDPEHKEKYLGNDETWEQAEAELRKALELMKEESFEGIGEAAFYAPKLDFMVMDALGREWQVATIQVDFVQPERFELTYTDADGQAKRPVMIHRAVYGSIERFLSVILEHYAGDLPLWLASVQVAILPISEKFMHYAMTVENQLKMKNIRVVLDDSNESISKKIRNAETMHYPLMLVVGQKEQDAMTIAVRSRENGDQGTMTLEEFFKKFEFGLPNRKE